MTMAPSATMTSPKPSKPLHPPSKSLKGQGGQGRKWCSPGITRAWCHKDMVSQGPCATWAWPHKGHVMANQWRSPMGGTSVGLPMGLPVRVTSGGHQWGAPVGVYQLAYLWGSRMGGTSGGHQWMSPKGSLPMGLPVGVTSGGLHFLAAGMRCWLFAAYRYKGMRKGSVSHLPGYRTTVSSQLPQRCPRPGDRMLPTCALCWWTQEGVARASDQSRYVMPRFRACYCCCLC